MKKFLTLVLSVFFGAACLGFSACSSASVTAHAAAPQATEVDGVTFDRTKAEVYQGESFTLTATEKGATAKSYVSVDAAVASVTANGTALTVTGVDAGETWIMAVDASGREYNACRVRVLAPETNENMTYNRYDMKTYTYPYWRGNTVYNETAMFIGSDDASPLLYPATRILKVTSYDLKTEYTEGQDYTYDKATNRIRRTANSRIPVRAESDWYMTRERGAELLPMEVNGIKLGNMWPTKANGPHAGKYMYFQENNSIVYSQVAITYEHEHDAGAWELPAEHTDKFIKLRRKLAAGETVTVAYYGDSVTVGANSSDFLGCDPRAERYADMLTSYMRARYPQATVNARNCATGGDTSQNGVDKFETKVAKSGPAPDFMVIAYGLNDLYTPTDQAFDGAMFAGRIAKIVNKAKALNEDMEILIISPMIGNFEIEVFYDTDAQERALVDRFADKENVAVAEVTKMHRQLLRKKGDRYRDITANNVNHPNDFATRIYAMTCLTAMFGADYYQAI